MKKLALTILVVLISQPFFAAFLKNVPQELQQPNGSVISCYATGDEYYHWLHDKNGFTIIRNSDTGYFVYADLVGDELVPTSYIPGIHNPAAFRLEPKLNIPAYKVAEMRRQKYHIPQQKGFNGTTNTGTLNNIVIFIRFSDQSEFTSSLSYYNTSFNGAGQVSMFEYFQEVSDNQLEINTQFFPDGGSTIVSYQDAQPRSYYQEYDETTNTNGYSGDSERKVREHTLLKNATESVKSQIEATGKDFDMDNDGNVDNIAYIIQGPTDGWSELLWPHMWALYTEDVRINGLRVYYYNFQLSDAFGVSVLCHEMFHTLGAPDLYRYDNDDIKPVGPWDIMASNRTPPQHMSAYMKMKYGKWFNTIPTITSEGTYTLASLSDDPFAAYRIPSPNSSEYFVVEYRKAEGDFESSVVGNGLVVYRINSSLRGNADGPPDEIYVYRPNGTNSVNGNIWSANFSSSSGRTEINDASNPSSFLSDGSAGGLNISNIGAAGETISFDVSFETVGYNAPKNLTVSAGTNFIDLIWEKPDNGDPTLIGYNVHRFGTIISTITNPNTISYQDQNLSPGIYSYYITANYTSPIGLSDPSNTATDEVLEMKPDLIINDLTLSESNTDAGSSIDANMIVKNRGNLVAQVTELLIYISPDNSLDAGDSKIETINVESLNPNDEKSINVELIIPDDLTTGNYYIIAIVDQDQSIDEVDETNNEASRMIGVRASYPDLKLISVESTVTEALPDQNISLTCKWENIGNKAAEKCDFAVAISEDNYFDDQDFAITLYQSPSLNPGESYSLTANYKLPGDIDPGDYYIVFLLDGNENIPESNESNNEDFLRIRISANVDLELSNLIINPSQVKDGDPINLSFDILNRGVASSTDVVIELFLLENNYFTNSDPVLYIIPISSIAAGEKLSIESSADIPEGMIEGTYYIHILSSTTQEPDDLNVDNNHIFRQIHISNQTDLDLFVSLEKAEYKPGESLYGNLLLSNLETKAVDESKIIVLLSTDNIPDSEDEQIDQIEVILLNGRSQEEYAFSFEIPLETRPGNYNIIGVVDAESLIPELNEQNNVSYESFRVLDVSSDKSIFNSAIWSVYPNPSQDWINISYKGSETAQSVLRILNYTGQIVLQQSLSLDRIDNEKIDISSLSPGYYYLQLIQTKLIWNGVIVIIR